MQEYTFKILRFDPENDAAPHFQSFVHHPRPKETILEALKDIRDQQDPSLAFRYSCREAVCGSCGLTINGEIGLACKILVDSLGTNTAVIEPLPNLELKKDLIVDMEPFWEAYRYIEPYLQPEESRPPAEGHRIEDKEMARIDQYVTCILCACCYSACPVASRDGRYIGPAAMAKLFRFAKDPRDRRPYQALARIDSPSGAWGCDTVFRCNDVCPKSVRPADGIEGLRRALVVKRIKRFFGVKR
jgi:succinate dehydrogenase / fumarate reductase iron-sulfur subunit